jgi:hypothetical protein
LIWRRAAVSSCLDVDGDLQLRAGDLPAYLCVHTKSDVQLQLGKVIWMCRSNQSWPSNLPALLPL